MPVCGSGVMLEVKIVPNGVFIGSPPAKILPSRAVWQAMQSPARARYSPLAITAASCAKAGNGPVSNQVARKAASRACKVLGIRTISPLQFGGLPQASGIGRLPRLANDGSV